MRTDGVFRRAFSSTDIFVTFRGNRPAGSAFCSTHSIVAGNRGKTRVIAQSLIGRRTALKATKNKVLTSPVSKVMDAIDPLTRYQAPTVHVRHV